MVDQAFEMFALLMLIIYWCIQITKNRHIYIYHVGIHTHIHCFVFIIFIE